MRVQPYLKPRSQEGEPLPSNPSIRDHSKVPTKSPRARWAQRNLQLSSKSPGKTSAPPGRVELVPASANGWSRAARERIAAKVSRRSPDVFYKGQEGRIGLGPRGTGKEGFTLFPEPNHTPPTLTDHSSTDHSSPSFKHPRPNPVRVREKVAG